MTPYRFAGHRSYVDASASRAGVPPHLFGKIADSDPLLRAARMLSGLVEISRGIGDRPPRPDELGSIRGVLLHVEQVRWHYRIAAEAVDANVAEARRAFGLGPADAGGEPPPPEWPDPEINRHLRAAADRLGLPPFVATAARHAPELWGVGHQLGEAFNAYRRAPKERGVAVLHPTALETVRALIDGAAARSVHLRVLAEASDAMIGDAYTAFGLELPAGPLPGMPESRCCLSRARPNRMGTRPAVVRH